MKIAMITMVYNDEVILSLWVKHYRKQLPDAHLIVIDHGSNPPVKLNVDNLSVIRLQRSDFDDRRRSLMISQLQRAFLNEFDYVGYTDTDELIVAKINNILRDSLIFDGGGHFDGAIVACGVNIWHRPSFESAIDLESPIFKQRTMGIIEKAMCKPFISKFPASWIPGFHTSNLKPIIGSGYFMFHLKYMDCNTSLSRLNLTKSINWSNESLSRGWGRHQRIEDSALLKKFIRNEKNSLGLLPDLIEKSSLYMQNLVDGYILDSEGNYRCDADLQAVPVKIPEALLVKLP